MSAEQGTQEWHQERAGKLTASRLADAIAKTKSGWGASRANVMATLIAERLSGTPAEGFTTPAMQWGIDTEAEARTAYEFYRDVTVQEVGFVPHPKIAMSGASPDGLVGEDGLVEIKCPNTATQIDTLLGGAVPGKYVTQMQWQMACTGRQWCDFVSYDPRLPAPLNLYIVRVTRDDGKIAELTGDVKTFLAELDEKVAALRERFGMKEAA
jgi:putative phage-type endonuclease